MSQFLMKIEVFEEIWTRIGNIRDIYRSEVPIPHENRGSLEKFDHFFKPKNFSETQSLEFFKDSSFRESPTSGLAINTFRFEVTQ